MQPARDRLLHTHLERPRLVLGADVVEALDAVVVQARGDRVPAPDHAVQLRRRGLQLAGDVAGDVEVAEANVVEVDPCEIRARFRIRVRVRVRVSTTPEESVSRAA